MIFSLVCENQLVVFYDQLAQIYGDIRGVASTMFFINKVPIYICFIPFRMDTASVGEVLWVRDGSGTGAAQRRQ